MDQNKIQAEKDLLDKFVFLYTKNIESLKNFENNNQNNDNCQSSPININQTNFNISNNYSLNYNKIEQNL